MSQRRVPRGVFTGGRYAADERGEADVDLGRETKDLPLHMVEGAVVRRAEAERALKGAISRRDNLGVWQRAERSKADAEVTAAEKRLNLAMINEESALGLTRPPEDPQQARDHLIDDVVSARDVLRDADRDVREAEKALRDSFEFPPVKALAKRRVKKARQHMNESAHTLATSEQRLSDWDNPTQPPDSETGPDQ